MKDENIRCRKKTCEKPCASTKIQDLIESLSNAEQKRSMNALTRILPAFNGVTMAIQRSTAIATIIYVEERMEKL